MGGGREEVRLGQGNHFEVVSVMYSRVTHWPVGAPAREPGGEP